MFEIIGGGAVVILGILLNDKIRKDNKRRIKAALEERRSKLLEGLSAVVFVREPNGSRTNLEHHLEQELISRGARVLVADQQAGNKLVRQGEFSPLHPEAHITVFGTLVIHEGITGKKTVYTETQFDFAKRRAVFDRQYEVWLIGGRRSVEPLLEARKTKLVDVNLLHYQFSFRLVGKDGAMLASGTCEKFPEAEKPSYEETLRALADEAISILDQTDVWTRVVIS